MEEAELLAAAREAAAAVSCVYNDKHNNDVELAIWCQWASDATSVAASAISRPLYDRLVAAGLPSAMSGGLFHVPAQDTGCAAHGTRHVGCDGGVYG